MTYGKKIVPVSRPNLYGVLSVRVMPVYLPDKNYQLYRANNFVY